MSHAKNYIMSFCAARIARRRPSTEPLYNNRCPLDHHAGHDVYKCGVVPLENEGNSQMAGVEITMPLLLISCIG